MRTLLLSTVAALPLLVLTGCDEFSFGDSERYREDFHYSYSLSAGGRLNLETHNGSIDITTWDRDTIEINGTKYASTQAGVRDMKIDITPSSSSVSIRTIVPFGLRNTGARFNIRVPRRIELDRIITSNGSIRAEDFEGVARIRTSNGGIRIYRHNGELDVTTSNGSIEALDHKGNASLRTSNGAVRVDMNEGALQANTSNGSINARLMRPDPSQPVRLESSNGRIELSMDAVRDVRATTSNSSILVRLPEHANARVRARTSNSSISTDFDVLVRNIQKHSLDGTLGNGGPMIDVSTSNGSIRLARL